MFFRYRGQGGEMTALGLHYMMLAGVLRGLALA